MLILIIIGFFHVFLFVLFCIYCCYLIVIVGLEIIKQHSHGGCVVIIVLTAFNCPDEGE